MFLYAITAISGLINGCIGTGGGIVLALALQSPRIGAGKQSYRIALGFLAAFSALSCLLCLWGQWELIRSALPLALFSALGGHLGARLFSKLQAVWVHRLFLTLLLIAGGRMLWAALRGG